MISVVSGSPAASAGLKGGNLDVNGNRLPGGDVITAIDGKTVTSVDSLASYIARKNVGDTVSLTVFVMEILLMFR